MHSPTVMFVLLSTIVASLGSATSVFLGPHTVFATPTHTPLLHLGSSYSLQVPFAAPTAHARTTIFPAQHSGALLYFAEGGQQLLDTRAQQSSQYSLDNTRAQQSPQYSLDNTRAQQSSQYSLDNTRAQQPSQYSLENTRYRSGSEQASQGYPSNYARTSQDFQTSQSPAAFAPEARVPSQDFAVSPQRQDYPTSRTTESNFAGRSSVQEFPVEDRRTQLPYPARPSQNFQNVQEERRVQQQQQQTYPEAQTYSRAPLSQSYLDGRRVSEDFPASPYPESRPTPVYSATPAPLAYSNPPAAPAPTSPAYAARPTARTFQETSPVQEYPVSTTVQGYSPNPTPQAYSQQTVVPQSYSRTSIPQGYTGEQFQEDVAARQPFPESRALAVSRGYPVSLHHPQPHQTYSVNFEGSGFGYGYTVQRQQLTTPAPPLFGHAN